MIANRPTREIATKRSLGVSIASIVVLTILAMHLSACVADFSATGPAPHPLVGRIHDVKRGTSISRDALFRELASADYVLLGEVHDNAEHHRVQADVLRYQVARGRRPALAMEQFDREHQPAIDNVVATGTVLTAESLADAGRFNRKGWQWTFYAPLLGIAAEAQLPVIALNLSRERTRAVSRDGFATLGADAIARLALDRDWTSSQQDILQRAIADGHCGQLPASVLPRMVAAQRARDAWMADALLQRAQSGAIGIMGSGHARNDVGVPVYLSARAPAKRVISVGFVEVDRQRRSVADYATPPAKSLPFDYAWFTAAAERDDPCAGLAMPR